MKRMTQRLAFFLIVGVTFSLALGGYAAAQDKYPSKPITYLVTFNPGGQSDREARRQQPLLEKILGQKILVDYKVGGGGPWAGASLCAPSPTAT